MPAMLHAVLGACCIEPRGGALKAAVTACDEDAVVALLADNPAVVHTILRSATGDKAFHLAARQGDAEFIATMAQAVKSAALQRR